MRKIYNKEIFLKGYTLFCFQCENSTKFTIFWKNTDNQNYIEKQNYISKKEVLLFYKQTKKKFNEQIFHMLYKLARITENS